MLKVPFEWHNNNAVTTLQSCCWKANNGHSCLNVLNNGFKGYIFWVVKQGSHYLEPFDVPGRSLPPADFTQLSVRKSANCLFLIIWHLGLGETNLKKNTDSWNIGTSDPSSSPAYQKPACSALRADRRNWKYPSLLLGCVYVSVVDLLDLTPLTQPFCVPLPLFTLSLSLSLSLVFFWQKLFWMNQVLCSSSLFARFCRCVEYKQHVWQFSTAARRFPKASGAE